MAGVADRARRTGKEAGRIAEVYHHAVYAGIRGGHDAVRAEVLGHPAFPFVLWRPWSQIMAYLPALGPNEGVGIGSSTSTIRLSSKAGFESFSPRGFDRIRVPYPGTKSTDLWICPQIHRWTAPTSVRWPRSEADAAADG